MARTNWLWPLVLIGGALLLLAYTLGALAPIWIDLISRAWPILLVLLGLSVLIGRRIRYGNILALGVCGVLLAGVVFTAYSKQSSVQRNEYQVAISQPIGADVTAVRVSVTMLLAQMDVQMVPGQTVSGEFVGSEESKVVTNYSVADGIGTLTITEVRPNAIPKLSAIGRGKLTLKLPTGVTIDDLTIRGGDGSLVLDATGAALRNLTTQIQSGGITLTLPSLPPESALGGSVKTRSGDLLINVPPGLTIKLTIESGKPVFDPNSYLLLSGGVLQTTATRDFQAVLTVGASGTVTVKP